MIKLFFFIALGMVFYVYAGYPLIVFFLSSLKRRPVRRQAHEPMVSILIAAFNEVDVIAATIRNKLALDYPAEKLEIIVVSDGSDDGTDAVVHGLSEPNVRLLRQEPRAGKTSALNMAVAQAHGDILVFSDANSLYDHKALRQLVANFADAEVGYVSGRMVYTNPDGSYIGDGCSAYMKYENF